MNALSTIGTTTVAGSSENKINAIVEELGRQLDLMSATVTDDKAWPSKKIQESARKTEIDLADNINLLRDIVDKNGGRLYKTNGSASQFANTVQRFRIQIRSYQSLYTSEDRYRKARNSEGMQTMLKVISALANVASLAINIAGALG